MVAFKDLFASERGLLAIVLILAATVLAAIGQMPIGAWQDFALWIFGIYAGAKTVTSSVSLLKRPAPTTASGVIEAVTSVEAVAPAPAEPAA
jgi:hypothetical protein